MATEATSRKRGSMLLLLLLLVDAATVKSSPPQLLQHPPGTKKLSDAVQHDSSVVMTTPGDTVQNEDTPDTGEELTKKIENNIQLREELVTDDLQRKTLHIDKYLELYNEKVQDLEDFESMIKNVCGEVVLTAVKNVLNNLAKGEELLSALTKVALLQLHDCPKAAVEIAKVLADVVGTDDSELEESSDSSKQGNTDEKIQKKSDACEAVVECHQKEITTVRQILSRFPSLLVLYDTAVAAIFASSYGPENMTDALVDGVIENLNINKSAIQIAENSTALSARIRIVKRSSCVDKKEAKAQAVISWIPFIGTLYNLISSAVYAAKGCNDAAKERALEGTIDLAMDAVSVVTFGSAAAVAQGAKTAIKVGVKAGVKAALKSGAKAAGKSFKKVAGNILKETVAGYKNPIKGAVKEVKDAITGVASVAKAVPGAVKSASEWGKNSGQALKKSLQNLKSKAGKKVDDVSPKDKLLDSQDLLRCKRTGGCAKRRRVGSEENEFLDKTDKQFQPRASQKTLDMHKKRWDELWEKFKILDDNSLPRTQKGELFKNIKGIDLTKCDLTNKEQFQALQQSGQFPLYVKQDLGGVKVEYLVQRQPYTSSKNQVVIKFKGSGGSYNAGSYVDMIRPLDNFINGNVARRKDVANAMLNAINSKPNSAPTLGHSKPAPGLHRSQSASAVGRSKPSQTLDRSKSAPSLDLGELKMVLESNPKARDSAAEFIVITQVAEAVPGRISGMDAYFRSLLKKMAEDGQMTFKQLYENGIVMGKGHLKHGKTFVKGSDPAERLDALQNSGADSKFVKDMLESMSDPDRRRRHAI